MNSGSLVRRTLVILTVAALVWAAIPAYCQVTDDLSCASDSLVIISPDADNVDAEISYAGNRLGGLVSWTNIPDELSTCSVLVGDDALDVEVTLSGEYSGNTDRVFQFTTGMVGEVAATDVNWLPFHWENLGSTISGTIFGDINLSCSGGLWEYDVVTGDRVQHNGGLPTFLKRANIQAFAQGRDPATPGTWLLSLSSGSDPLNDSVGLWQSVQNDDGSRGDWLRISEDVVVDDVAITSIAYAPNSNEVFAVGTEEFGLGVTHDGGQTFDVFTSDLYPEDPLPPTTSMVNALNWDNDRLWFSIVASALYYSDDNGVSFERVENLEVQSNLDWQATEEDPVPEYKFPNIVDIVVLSDTHIMIGLKDHGLYESIDGGDTWTAATGAWIVGDPQDPNQWQHTGRSILVHPDNHDLIIVGTDKRGLWRTADGGDTWVRVANDDPDALLGENVSINYIVRELLYFDDGSVEGLMIAVADDLGFLTSSDAGLTWSAVAEQPGNPQLYNCVLNLDDSGTVLFPSLGGGIYKVGSPISLTETLVRTPENMDYWDVSLGLSVAFSAGSVDTTSSFQIVAQDFQGWAVWRSEIDDPYNMEMIGLYDKTNPESCIEGYCGDENYIITPRCFADRRAACFQGVAEEDSVITFYDDNVFNGFIYYYAITTFDYGNTALDLPSDITNPMMFSSRYPGDENAAYSVPGYEGALCEFVVNTEAPPMEVSNQIYCFPNPLRLDAGFTGYEGEQVVFTNIAEGSTIRIFTVSGDEIAIIESDTEQFDGNVYWIARNDNGEQLASGVYIYKVETVGREEAPFYSKLVVIR